VGGGCVRSAPLEAGLVEIRLPGEYLALRQHVGLAAKAADPLDTPQEVGPVLRLDALQLFGGWAVRDELRQLLVQLLLHGAQVSARLRRGVDPHLAADLPRVDEGRHVGRDAIVVHEPLVQPRRLAGREHVGHQIEIVGVRAAPLGDVPDFVDPRLWDAVLEDLSVRPAAFGRPRALFDDRRAGGDGAEVPLHLLAYRLGVHVAGNDEHGVCGPVVGAEPVLHVVQ
jgi:hypothetical protein